MNRLTRFLVVFFVTLVAGSVAISCLAAHRTGHSPWWLVVGIAATLFAFWVGRAA